MDEIVCGAKGSGKTKYVLVKVLKALRKGKLVVTNIDLDIAQLPLRNVKSKRFDGLLVRIPDIPRAEDFFSLGLGYEGDRINDARNGVIVIDEASLSFNAYQYMEKALQERFDYLINSRKYRFDVYYLVHDPKTLASRIRRSFGNDVITRCNSVYSIFNVDQESPLRRVIPNVHVARTRKAVAGEELRRSFSKPTFFKAAYLQRAYDTEQKYREPLPLLVPFVGFDKLQDEAYIFPHHPVTREKPAANHKFVDISAPYTCLPPRLSGKEVKRDKRGEVVSLLVMLVFFGLGVFWLSRGEGPVESSVEALVPAPVVRPESVVVEEQEVSSVNECDFLTTLKYLPKSEMFSDNWFLQLVSEYQPVVKDFNYHRGVPSVYQPLDFNVLFFKDEQLVASTNSVELESFGWHSFRWSRGVFFVQKSYWVEDDSEGVVNQRETFLFLQTDVVPPTFSSTIAGLGEKKGLFDSVGLGD